MAERPIFFDPTGRRKKRFRLGLSLFIALLLVSAIALAATIELAPPGAVLPVAVENSRAAPPPTSSAVARGGKAVQRAIRDLFFPASAHPRHAQPGGALAVGFTVPWDPESVSSLSRNIERLDWVAPVWLTVTGPNHQFNQLADPDTRQVINASKHKPLVVPVLQNAVNGQWDANVGALLRDKAARGRLVDQIVAYLAANNAGGLIFDLEQVAPGDQPAYRALLADARVKFRPRGWVIGVAVPVGEGNNYTALAQFADKVFLMAYDEHSDSDPPGPIASRQWWLRSIADAVRGIPVSKIVVTIGNYAYDWHGGTADVDTVEEAWQTAAESDAKPMFDPASGNSGFAYDDDDGHHVVWILDAVSAADEITYLRRAGIKQVALWRMGAEDPALWQVFGRGAGTSLAGVEQLPAGSNVDIEGPGEILRIAATPTAGERRVTVGTDGLVKSADFSSMPRPWVVRRTGYRPGVVALTFDDGPDPKWTPQILDILKAKHVPGTFFVVGENMLTERGLMKRMVDEGHEVGSHTYTHPNLATTPRAQTLFELNANQRLFQAYTGRSFKLFRPPYFGDAEPTTADELGPVLAAQNRGYITVGLHVDAEDWQRPGVAAIVKNVLDGVALSPPGVRMSDEQCAQMTDQQCSHSIVLLHDAGGDRQQTIEALPIIIDQLRARGYQLVAVSDLAGLSRDAAMPPLSRSEATLAKIDLGLFQAVSASDRGLRILFAVAITLGILRALALSGLALNAAKREIGRVKPPIDPKRAVTVIIPAYNEERVIERSVRQVLASTEVELQLIVVDDGSKDRTSAVVAEHFGSDPRVTLLTIPNGGKARALNLALSHATSEIVIALDADTQFEPTTVARLARWFDDPKLGAVAGNAKVGNRINLVTKWQALEYITAQNLERRALTRLGAMMVVPGAVGAWRKAAIMDVGGYPPDTLAEDQDLTIAIQRKGWAVNYDQAAVAWTEAPHTLRGLAKQRFRWAFGTLQCLWKHGAVMRTGKPRGLAWIGMPQAILFQLLFAAVSPVIDLALIVNLAQTALSIHEHGYEDVQGDLGHMLAFWLIFAAIDLLAAGIAFALERKERWSLLGWLLPQRFVYRQVMYYVVLKALVQALRGPMVGWTSVARTGSVEVRPRADASA
ncbi:polysaccharide deacetylase family protein [Sphingomonas sp. ASV193]|uniref:polysaccharide deacetylase family protein n=1 Tax=Sphingomonas sp. ASV193 TaxID=3144405 RepID=UPI0032E93626